MPKQMTVAELRKALKNVPGDTVVQIINERAVVDADNTGRPVGNGVWDHGENDLGVFYIMESPSEEVGSYDTPQDICPFCKSEDIGNDGPSQGGRLFVSCYNCGYQWHEPDPDICPVCKSPLTYSISDGADIATCHNCGYENKIGP